MKVSKTAAFFTLAIWLVTSLMVSGNLVLCFSTSHTALEFQHTSIGLQGACDTRAISENNSEACVDVPLSKKVNLPIAFNSVFLQQEPVPTPVVHLIRYVSSANLTDRQEVARSVKDFVSTIRLII